MIDPLVIELRADRTPGEQAQGCYTRVLAALCAGDPDARWHLPYYIRLARRHAAAVARDGRRNAAEHTRQGLITERFGNEEPFEPAAAPDPA